MRSFGAKLTTIVALVFTALPWAMAQTVSNRVLELNVTGHAFSDSYGSEKANEGNQFILVDVVLRNVVSADLVFDQGVEEKIILDNMRVFRAFLHWNGERTFTLDDQIQRQGNHLPDLVELEYSGDTAKGQLVFEIPSTEPVSAALVLTHDLFGVLEIDLIGNKPAIVFANEFMVNGDVQLSASLVDVNGSAGEIPGADKERIEVRLAGHGGRRANDNLLPVELSGLRLYAPGENPIAAVGEPRIVFLPDRLNEQQLVFEVPVDAPVLALILPLPPPAVNGVASKEPYWIVPLRGDPPTLVGTASTVPTSSSPVSQAQQRAPATPSAPSEALPPRPSLSPKNPAIDAATAARLAALHERPVPAVASTTASSVATAVELKPGELIAATFAEGEQAHYYRLKAVSDGSRLTEILLAAPAGVDMALSLDGSNRVSPRRKDVLAQLRLSSRDLILDVRNATRKTGDYKLLWDYSGTVETGREFEPNDREIEELLPHMSGGSERKVIHGNLSGGDDIDYFLLVSEQAAVATLELDGPDSATRGKLRMDKRNGEAVLFAGDTQDRRHIMQDVYLLPGENLFSVHQGQGEYSVQASLQAVPGPAYEREPNDTDAFAHRLAYGESRYGRLSTNRDVDVYSFSVHANTPVRIGAEAGAGGKITATIRQDDRRLASLGPAESIDDEIQLAPGNYLLELTSRSAPSTSQYTVTLEHAPLFERRDALPVTLRFAAGQSIVAPYYVEPQLLRGELIIENTSNAAVELLVSARTSHEGCLVVPASSTVSLAANASTSIPAEIRVRRDVHSNGPIAVEFAPVELRWQ